MIIWTTPATQTPTIDGVKVLIIVSYHVHVGHYIQCTNQWYCNGLPIDPPDYWAEINYPNWGQL